VLNYLGKSQYTADPLFDGMLDDFRIYNYVLAPTEVSVLAGTSLTAAQWRQAYFGTSADTGDAADTADPDGDRVVNKLERAFGGEPTLYEPDLQPTVEVAASNLHIHYRKSKALTDTTIAIEEADAPSANWSLAVGSTQVLSDHGSYEVVRFSHAIDTNAPLFLRVAVE